MELIDNYLVLRVQGAEQQWLNEHDAEWTRYFDEASMFSLERAKQIIDPAISPWAEKDLNDGWVYYLLAFVKGVSK